MSISLDIREWCDEADVDGNACDELRAIADRIDREMAEKERLKKENAELTAELDDWKGNAEGFQPYAYMSTDSSDSWEKLEEDAMGRACELAGSGPLRCGDMEQGEWCLAEQEAELVEDAKKVLLEEMDDAIKRLKDKEAKEAAE